MIEIQHLRKSFNGKEVLRGVNLDVQNGWTTVVIGKSGCGKSVLLKHIVGLIKPDSGTVLVDGEDVVHFSEKGINRLRRRFGMVFQGAALFDSMTVAENVGLGLRELTNLSASEIKVRVHEKLSLVDLTGTEDMKPSELSGGMRKRIGLARALAMDPEFVLYDEPTTGLDPVTAKSINQLIIDLQKKLSITSILVTHDLASACMVGDRVAMLSDGVVLFEGTPKELLESKNPEVEQFVSGYTSLSVVTR